MQVSGKCPELGAWHGAYLLSLVESFAVTVGQVHGAGHHARAGFELLKGSLHVPAAGTLCADRRGERRGRTRGNPQDVQKAWLGYRGRGKGSVRRVTTFCSE